MSIQSKLIASFENRLNVTHYLLLIYPCRVSTIYHVNMNFIAHEVLFKIRVKSNINDLLSRFVSCLIAIIIVFILSKPMKEMLSI